MRMTPYIVLLLILTISGTACTSSQPMPTNSSPPPTPEPTSISKPPTPPLIQLTYDGESCTYDGPALLKAGTITLHFHNESEGMAALNFVRHTGDETIQDAIDYIGEEPSYLHHPNWSAEVWGVYGGTRAGETRIWEGDLEPGIHHMVCQRFSDGGVFFGTGLTVEE